MEMFLKLYFHEDLCNAFRVTISKCIVPCVLSILRPIFSILTLVVSASLDRHLRHIAKLKTVSSVLTQLQEQMQKNSEQMLSAMGIKR